MSLESICWLIAYASVVVGVIWIPLKLRKINKETK